MHICLSLNFFQVSTGKDLHYNLYGCLSKRVRGIHAPQRKSNTTTTNDNNNNNNDNNKKKKYE